MSGNWFHCHEHGRSVGRRDTGLLRMQQAGVIPTDYCTAMVEILADNADPIAGEFYAALGMPFATLVGQMAEAYAAKA